MADVFDQFEILLREYISPAAVNLEFDDDDPAWNLMGAFPPETVGGRNDQLTAGYMAQYRIRIQSGGRVAGGRFTGNTPVQMGADSHLYMGSGADAKYLDPRKTPRRSWVPINIPLKRVKGSVTVEHEQIMAELASTPIDEVAGSEAEDAIKKLRSYFVNFMYGDGTASLSTCTNNETVTETAGGVKVELTGGPFARFMMGDLLVAGSNAEPRVQRAGAINGYMRVVNIDADDRAIYLQSEPGEGNISITAGDHLMYADTYDFTQASHALAAMVPEGFNSLLITSGVFPGSASQKFTGGLNVTNHSYLKAFVTANSPNVDPTMPVMTEILDKISDIGKMPPPVLLGQRSLWTLYAQLDQEARGMAFVPHGQTFNAAGGVAGPTMTHQQHRFTRMESARIADNAVIAISPDTWRKYIPLGDRTIRWVYGSGPLSGAQSIFGAVSDGVQLTELADAPFNSYFQVGCIDPLRNFRITGLNTQRDV